MSHGCWTSSSQSKAEVIDCTGPDSEDPSATTQHHCFVIRKPDASFDRIQLVPIRSRTASLQVMRSSAGLRVRVHGSLGFGSQLDREMRAKAKAKAKPKPNPKANATATKSTRRSAISAKTVKAKTGTEMSQKRKVDLRHPTIQVRGQTYGRPEGEPHVIEGACDTPRILPHRLHLACRMARLGAYALCARSYRHLSRLGAPALWVTSAWHMTRPVLSVGLSTVQCHGATPYD